MNITYRVAEVTDAEELKRLNDTYNGKDYNTIEGISEGILREDAETVFVAKADDKLVGFCCGQLLKSICYDAFYVEISELYVEESMQGQGIGSGLLKFAEDWYRQKDIHHFTLFTGGENLKAQKFYEHLGYLRSNEVLYRKSI
jgi:GNAT superfamily N-acetyltransferase